MICPKSPRYRNQFIHLNFSLTFSSNCIMERPVICKYLEYINASFVVRLPASPYSTSGPISKMQHPLGRCSPSGAQPGKKNGARFQPLLRQTLLCSYPICCMGDIIRWQLLGGELGLNVRKKFSKNLSFLIMEMAGLSLSMYKWLLGNHRAEKV